MQNAVVYNGREASRFYSVGRVLWRRFLMRLKHDHVKHRKGEKRRRFRNENAYAIVLAAVKMMGYESKKLKKSSLM